MANKVNIKNSSLQNSSVISGDGNTVNIQNLNRDKNHVTIDWDVVQNELIDVSGKLSKSSEEYAVSKKALNCAMKEDKKGFIDVLRKNSACFLSDIFKGVASGTLVRLILSLIE